MDQRAIAIIAASVVLVACQAPGETAPAANDPPAKPLTYRFNPGEEYGYAFTLKAERADIVDRSSGYCTLGLSREAMPPEFAEHEKTHEGNGSGFAVTRDGYIVTCAHVVEGSIKIEAVLGERTWPAEVVAFDKQHDLALLHVAATDLPTLSLGDSDAVELAEEVRAVGYPLSNLLGESVKITRCSIGGILNASGRKRFHVDGSVNPGNSGGPLVNEMGQVVGVTSAKLARDDIDGVGFAVPAREVQALLESKGIRLTPAAPAQKLAGPQLAKQVTPAVSLIKVTVGPGGYNTAKHFVLDFSGNVSTATGKARLIRGAYQLPPNENERESAKLLVSERGELLAQTGKIELRYLFGHLSTLVVEPVGDPGQRTWKTERIVFISHSNGQQANPFPLGFGRRGPRNFGGFPFGGNQQPVTYTLATETCSYERTKEEGGLATITKRYNVETAGSSKSAPTIKFTGDGTFTFNRERGCAEALDYKATFVRTANSASTTIPLSMEWRRLPQAQLDRLRATESPNPPQTVAQAKPGAGKDTEFVGGPRGKAQRVVDEDSIVYGFDCGFGSFNGINSLSEIVPLFSRDQPRRLLVGEVARDGYAVGAVNIHAESYVLGIQLVFMRVKDDGQLDPGDVYTGEWMGAPASGKPSNISGEGLPIIGIHLRRGAVIDALALVVKEKKADEKAAATADGDQE